MKITKYLGSLAILAGFTCLLIIAAAFVGIVDLTISGAQYIQLMGILWFAMAGALFVRYIADVQEDIHDLKRASHLEIYEEIKKLQKK